MHLLQRQTTEPNIDFFFSQEFDANQEVTWHKTGGVRSGGTLLFCGALWQQWLFEQLTLFTAKGHLYELNSGHTGTHVEHAARFSVLFC